MTPSELIGLRERAGMTQQQLADALGRNRRTIYRYEKGSTAIPFDKEIALRQVLAVGSRMVASPAGRKSKSNK